jgi:hypothetical protein
VEKLLNHFLPAGSFFKVRKVHDDKRADWIIDTDNYRIIVEQKSSAATLNIRTIYPDINSIYKYFEIFKEGILQLDRTLKAYYIQGKKHIKLVLHYESLFVSEGAIKPAVLEMAKDSLSSTDGFYFLDVGEFEHLIQALSESESILDNIISEKIKIEKGQPLSGKEFSQIIPFFFKKPNLFMAKVVNHYDSFFAF